ncbi:MAG: hypothetical protein GY793_11775 [Proteobacteria bacterium]|nr:hypothetical protein [Pseudomonadota bacterium]
MTFVKEKSYGFLVEEVTHTRLVDKVESLYNRANRELTAKFYMAELTEKRKAGEVLKDWLKDFRSDK